MVAHNPLFSGRWTIKKFNATVVNDIWPEVAFFSLVAAMVALVSEKTSHQLVIPNQLLTVLGTVLGLVISFRTSSAYERYQEGRKMWTNITIASRNLAQMFWIHVPFERDNKGEQKKITALEAVIEKKTMVNLVQAFPAAVKHFLRGEPGVYYQDLYPLVCILPRYANLPPAEHTEDDMLPLWRACEDEDHPYDPKSRNIRSVTDSDHDHKAHTNSLPNHLRAETLVEGTESDKSWFRSMNGKRASTRRTFDPEKVLPTVDTHRPLEPARNPPETTVYDYFPIFRLFRWLYRLILRRAKPAHEIKREKEKRRKRLAVESNVPLEICLALSSYSAFLIRSGLLQPALATGVTNNITMLQDTLSNLERIRNTPLPFAYQAHLRMSLWLYLFFLPFQIWINFKYLTIPGTAFASFLLLGFLEIGQEIENPFNYDLNDLDLDSFCLNIQRELQQITAHTSPDPHSYIFTGWNQPFAPADRRTAEQMIATGEEYVRPGSKDEPGMSSIRRTLVRSWRDIDHMTRRHDGVRMIIFLTKAWFHKARYTTSYNRYCIHNSKHLNNHSNNGFTLLPINVKLLRGPCGRAGPTHA
ncbi:Bestrophin, RFP-TM, chloride channel-domain-containing protein [Infundibulicybe gibba]|nr:Bestrophin, RFP-TM, chloride channel-domain-containing protein [Infundibulicybe gibba]